MPDEILLPSGWKQPLGYSNGIVAPAGPIVFLNPPLTSGLLDVFKP